MVEERHSDIVDEAFETLRRTQPSEGPSLQALEQTLQAVHQAQQKSNRISLLERIRNVNKLIKYPVAAAITVAALAAGAYLLLGRGAGIAFADVRHQIEQAQTMTMTATTNMERPGSKKPVTAKVKMYIKSPGLMRQEMWMQVQDHASTNPSSSQPAPGPEGMSISITDMNKQRGIALIPAQKLAIPMDFKNVPPETLAKMKRQDFLEGLKRAVAGEHKELGERKIENHLAKGYRCQAPDMPQATMDLWVDAATGNPLLIEQTLPEQMGMGKIKVTMTDFVLNPKLDDSLFDVTVPKGYKVLMNQDVDFNLHEEDLVKWLGILAKVCDGVFPKNFTPPPEAYKKEFQREKQSTSGPKSKPSTTEETVMKEIMVKMLPMQKALGFQMRITLGGGEFVYAGEGVKLGDKATPILWYKAKDAKKYRVIYGDLHAEDAKVAPKHSTSQPQRHLVATQPVTGPR